MGTLKNLYNSDLGTLLCNALFLAVTVVPMVHIYLTCYC